jgi:hypothetical protein
MGYDIWAVGGYPFVVSTYILFHLRPARVRNPFAADCLCVVVIFQKRDRRKCGAGSFGIPGRSATLTTNFSFLCIYFVATLDQWEMVEL